jgi:hypothetical protein
MITRDSFFALKPELREVRVPMLGGSVYVKEMTAGERDRFEVEHLRSADKDFRARMAAATVCDSEGVLLFGPDDVAKLSKLPADALTEIVMAANKVNRMSADDVEELSKN